MDQTDRDRLEFKKARTRARLARAHEGQYLRPLIVPLRRSGLRCSRVGARALSTLLAPVVGLDGRDGRIDWARLPDGTCRAWTSREKRDDLFRHALEALARPSDRILVVWHPMFAGLRIRAGDAAGLTTALLDAAPEVWVLPADRPGWLIESALFDNEICFARTLTRAVD
jgi:hypothetical protein